MYFVDLIAFVLCASATLGVCALQIFCYITLHAGVSVRHCVWTRSIEKKKKLMMVVIVDDGEADDDGSDGGDDDDDLD